MNIYQAIMKAADHIEANPSEFRFWSTRCPEHPGCGTPGCALGWISSFAKQRQDVHRGCLILMGLPAGPSGSFRFYRRMNDFDPSWREAATNCAAALREYADMYHGDLKPKPDIPASIRALFDQTVEDPDKVSARV